MNILFMKYIFFRNITCFRVGGMDPKQGVPGRNKKHGPLSDMYSIKLHVHEM